MGICRVTDDTLLLRQIHPHFVQNGRVGSLAFRPFPKDKGLLSVYDGDMISFEESWIHYTATQNLKSDGVMAVQVRECAAVQLPACSSPEVFAEHAHIDFRDFLGTGFLEG